ncbi:MAG: alpha/beta fold hydrolase [Deltaproteobacteria bacterium]|nr:alpha/beta fold hydrolase [Deltaproteobacteria bacterium]MBW2071838.1 alpha/beta fold hydrolase [Deltaproteobacteria bacterium]
MVEINRLTFSLSKFGVSALEKLFRASVHIHGAENIQDGVLIFVVNHFTRLETLILPYEFYKLTGKPVMALAYHGFFRGTLRSYLENIGAVSTKDPNRDRIIVSSLLKGDHSWLIFPEGMMIKDKKIVEHGRFLIYSATGSRRPPHTGAAVLALRTEFYRQRIEHLRSGHSPLLEEQLRVFGLHTAAEVNSKETFLVPVNVSYYPIRSRENAIERLASFLIKDLPERFREELLTEGTMLLAGVDIDISIGEPFAIRPWLRQQRIQQDILSPKAISPDEVLPSRALMRRTASKITMKVMDSIYRMTTVNHDHLAAYLLKYSPNRRLTVFELAQRLFLASQRVVALQGINFHRALHEDQRSQLCRLYPRKLADFLAVAEKSGVISLTGELITKKPLKMTSLFNFHTIRRDNTYLVILNEVEYLRTLIREIRRIAWSPAWYIRWQQRRALLKSDKAQFIRDYQEFKIDGESKPRHIGAPFFLRRFRPKNGILLAHGYMAAPEEMRPLANYLHQNGYAVYGVRLRGHGTSPEDLAARNWQDWLTSAEHGYLILANSCENIIAGGFSMGAGLALMLAANNLYKLRAVFAINPPFKLRRMSARLAPAVVVWNKLVNRFSREESRWHFVPNEPENPEINYLRNPVHGIKELLDLMDEVGKRAPEITLPALLIQASEDPVVHPEGTEELYQKLGSKDKELTIFPAARHSIIRGADCERVFARILEFSRNKLADN